MKFLIGDITVKIKKRSTKLREFRTRRLSQQETL